MLNSQLCPADTVVAGGFCPAPRQPKLAGWAGTSEKGGVTAQCGPEQRGPDHESFALLFHAGRPLAAVSPGDTLGLATRTLPMAKVVPLGFLEWWEDPTLMSGEMLQCNRGTTSVLSPLVLLPGVVSSLAELSPPVHLLVFVLHCLGRLFHNSLSYGTLSCACCPMATLCHAHLSRARVNGQKDKSCGCTAWKIYLGTYCIGIKGRRKYSGATVCSSCWS